MAPGDLPAVSRIAAAVHPGLPESDGVFAERLRLWPSGCLVLEVEGLAEAAGYAVAHPWARGRAVPLDSRLGALLRTPEVLYLHDLAILPAARGLGAGGAAVRRLARDGAGLPMALVAIGGTEAFWRAQGFAAGRPASGYGPGARLMERAVSPGGRGR